MDHIKEAFQKVKVDMDKLNEEIYSLKTNLAETREEMIKICDLIEEILPKTQKIQYKQIPAHPTHQPTKQTIPTHNPAHNLSLNALKGQNIAFSTGNRGVPTDRQTNQQTDTTYQKQQIFPEKYLKNPFSTIPSQPQTPIDDAAKILESLDSLKKEIRLKFKMLTDQEILVFSTLYQLEEEQGPADYKILAQRLNLTESSIRDYIGKLIKKGIPVEKTRIRNKQIVLSVSPNLKKIVSLSTILQLRGI